MLRDLLYRIQVLGMTKQQVLEVLGPADTEDEKRMSWSLGQTPLNNDNWLDLQIRNGRVENFDVNRWANP